MALTGVLRPGHVALRVLELEPALRHYIDVLGLIETARDDQGRVFLKAWDEHDHHSVVLREADSPGMDYMGFRVDSGHSLERLARDVERSGLATGCEWIAAGEHPRTGARFRFIIPTGHAIELFADKDKLGCLTGDRNPDPWPDDLRGMAPSRFDHCLLYGDDLDGTVRLFRDVLGFALAEEVVAGPDRTMIGAFLTCSNKAHDIAFIRHPEKETSSTTRRLPSTTGARCSRPPTSSPRKTSRSTSAPRATASRAAPPSTSSTPPATATKCSRAATSTTRTSPRSRGPTTSSGARSSITTAS